MAFHGAKLSLIPVSGQSSVHNSVLNQAIMGRACVGISNSISRDKRAQERVLVQGKEPSVEDRRHGSWYEQCVQPCLVELLGSALFIFTGCLSVIKNKPETGLLQPALTHRLALGLIIAVLGNISGGHFNPATSLTAMLIGGLNLRILLPDWISQLCGGLIGASLAKVVSPEERFWNASGAAFVQEPGQVARAVLAEIVLTVLLALAVCMGTINKKIRGPLAPLSIGFSITVDILTEGFVSGAYMNPAHAFGLAVVANHWDFHWIYWLGPFLASLLVGVFIRFFIGDGKTHLILRGW
ncbi:aquaporin-8 [Artibeus jamaicensis]|uniref:aquaporin-8 n=1 Tax=Artibeus jamaicensis TaxID=9417 RepID=UPI00235ABA2B|nr:aquaporin-8 [Artibeus jamaicensis]